MVREGFKEGVVAGDWSNSGSEDQYQKEKSFFFCLFFSMSVGVKRVVLNKGYIYRYISE